MLNVYFTPDEDESLFSICLPSLPFQVGSKITLDILNMHPGVYNVRTQRETEFEVVSIECEFTKCYGITVSTANSIWVRIKKIEPTKQCSFLTEHLCPKPEKCDVLCDAEEGLC